MPFFWSASVSLRNDREVRDGIDALRPLVVRDETSLYLLAHSLLYIFYYGKRVVRSATTLGAIKQLTVTIEVKVIVDGLLRKIILRYIKPRHLPLLLTTAHVPVSTESIASRFVTLKLNCRRKDICGLLQYGRRGKKSIQRFLQRARTRQLHVAVEIGIQTTGLRWAHYKLTNDWWNLLDLLRRQLGLYDLQLTMLGELFLNGLSLHHGSVLNLFWLSALTVRNIEVAASNTVDLLLTRLLQLG